MRVLSVVGFHGAGKTRVVVAVVRELTRRGYRVGTVKHIPSPDFTIDKPGKDTWLHAKAGAKLVVSVACGEVAKIEKRSVGIREVLDGLSGLDFVVVEGFKDFKGPAKIVVARSQAEASEFIDEFTLACVGVRGLLIPTFRFRQTREVVDLVERRAIPLLSGLDCGECSLESCEKFAAAVISGDKQPEACPISSAAVTVIVDGRKLSLNPFVQKVLSSTVQGIVSSLKGARGNEMEIRVVRHA